MLRAVLFDLGNTLMTEGAADEAIVAPREAQRLREVLASLGIADSPRLDEARPRYRALQRELAVESAQTLRQHRGPEMLRRVLSELGIELADAQVEPVARAWWLGFEAYGSCPFADAAETLRALKSLGLRTALVSNGTFPPSYWRDELDAWGWQLDAIVSSGELGWRKPHRLLFDRTLAALEVRPHEALMVGDVVEIDIAGAKALGIATVWKRNHAPLPPSPEADHTIDDLSELLLLPPLREAATSSSMTL